MRTHEIAGYGEAVRALRANLSPRYEELNELESYVATTQYDSRKADWLDNGSNVPLWERRPSIAHPIVRAAIASNVDLVLGEGRFPELSCSVSLGDDEDDPDGLTDEQREQVTKLLAEVLRQAKVKQSCREALAQAQGARTAVAILGVRNGKLFVDTTKAKWCTPGFAVSGEVESLEIRYPYLDRTYDPAARRWRVDARLYRRVIDETTDTTFLPAKAEEDGAEPLWKPDPKRSVKHALGFCPVVWYPHLRGTTTVNTIDGHAIHELALDEIVAHDYTLSQRHRCALLLEPQVCEFGVPAGYSPTETGRDGGVAAHPGPPLDLSSPDDIAKLSKMQSYLAPAGGGQEGARKKGPGYVWQYANEKARVEMLQMDAGALKALDDHARDLEHKLGEAMAVVFLDADNLKFASTLSGKALAILKQRQLDRCDQVRDDFGDGFIEPVARMLLRIAVLTRPRVRGLEKAVAAVAAFLEAQAEITFHWGDYFKPGVEEDKALVELAIRARDGGLATLKTAVRKVQRSLDIGDVDAYVDELEAEREAKRQADQKDQQDLMALAGVTRGGAPDPTGDRRGSGQAPPPNARGRGGALAAAAAPNRAGDKQGPGAAPA